MQSVISFQTIIKMKKHTLLAFVILVNITSAFCQTWSIDKAHTHIYFAIKYLNIADVDGSFLAIDAKVTADKADFSDASIEFSADVNNVNTDQEHRDAYLKSAEFFDAGKFATLVFKSTSVKRIRNNEYSLSGLMNTHSKDAEWFDSANYPVITFKSKKIVKTGASFIAAGELTIRGITKNISCPFTQKKMATTV
jgi:polyisoprenoid-binding protein YceI